MDEWQIARGCIVLAILGTIVALWSRQPGTAAAFVVVFNAVALMLFPYFRPRH